MARPERNNVDYFPFICSEGKKMFYLEETYGNDGFAVFIKLLRELAKTNYHYLNLSENTTIMFLSAKCKVTKEILLAIINDLVTLGKFDSILWNENKIIWCQDFIDSIQDAYNKRNNNCITYNGLIQLLISLGIRKQIKSISKGVNNTQSKEEYSILYKNIIPFFNSKFINEEKYLDCIRLMIENDKRNPDEILKVIEFARNDNFWNKNFMTLVKLRNKDKNGIMYYDIFLNQMPKENFEVKKSGFDKFELFGGKNENYK